MEKLYEVYLTNKILYFNQIKELTKYSNSSLQNILEKLVKTKKILKTKTKSNTFYEIKDKKFFALKFSEIAINKFNELNVDVKIPLLNFLNEIHRDVITIVLFGSSSKKEEKLGSDIDLLIVDNEKRNYDKIKKSVNLTTNYPLNIFRCTFDEFIKNEDFIIKEAKKGFPIFHEQIFYEIKLDES
ncbi:MAG: nucleotidyltransferase domain-containing protein [Candidatus Woesearchaeota archaeon]